LDRAVRTAALMDLYGGLLTPRQRQFVLMHYEDDLSFGEIAREQGISRQAVHDAVKHAERSLESYEARLGLNQRGLRPGGEAPQAPEAGDAGSAAAPPESVAALRGLHKRLEALHDSLGRSGGIIYNADGVTREVAAIARDLEALLPAQGED